MSDLVKFALIVVLGIIPFGFGIMYFLYRRTIVFVAASIVFVASMLVGIVSFAVSTYGLKSMFWAIPLCLVSLVSVNAVFKKQIQKPLKQINELISLIAQGVLDVSIPKTILDTNNEIGQVANSLDKTLQGLHNTSDFAKEIAKGNFDKKYNLLSDKDEIGLALIAMQQSLTSAAELEQKRKVEADQAAYITNGIAKFSDILRLQTSDVKALARNLMTELVEYIEAVQGGLFVLNEADADDVYFEMAGATAYNREKRIEQKIKVGEGLIGRCIFEKLPILMTEVPADYVNITSGLGESTPRCILLIPAVVDDKVYAVIELASFKVFDKHVVSFIEKLSENIASVISTVRNNENTEKLLIESKSYSEEMAAQEEELRQNIEELQATQEEMQRKEKELNEMSNRLAEQEEIMKQKLEQLNA